MEDTCARCGSGMKENGYSHLGLCFDCCHQDEMDARDAAEYEYEEWLNLQGQIKSTARPEYTHSCTPGEWVDKWKDGNARH